ncbi:DUF6562 domain-containing protein [Duncaniella muris]|uniref:DUF6562 domain-containing protein n=1 Tax=Duncaniella muris TaxID=2094150 RepID=UPI00263BA504|nr:DUF6562 domain-containing protein [Duncaniella muris]
MRYSFLSLVSIAILFTGCSTQEAPEYVEPPEDQCLIDLSSRHPVTVTVLDDDSFDESLSMDYPVSVISRSAMTPRRRYVVKAFDQRTGRVVAQGTSFTNSVVLSLPVGKITIIAWADYTTKDIPADSYYFTDEWGELLLADRYPYLANDYMKSAAWGRDDIAMAYNKTSLELPVKQATGGFRLIATDAPNNEVKTISVSYNKSVPCAIDGFSGEVSYTWDGCSFACKTTLLDSGNMQLGFDIFPVGTSETTVSVSVTMRDADGRIVAYVDNIDIPVQRGKITKVFAPFYSIREPHPSETPGGGGVNVDPTFNNEIVIVI